MRREPEKINTTLAICWHCGNENNQNVYRSDYFRNGNDYSKELWCEVRKCSTCEGVLVYITEGTTESRGRQAEQGEPRLVYPAGKELPAATPKTIRQRYLEAARIRPISPTAFALLLRTALEEICNDFQVAPLPLPERFVALVQKQQLPEVFHELAIHIPGPDASATPESIDRLDRFFRAVLEYVYVAPALVKEVHQPSPAEGRANTTSP